MKVLGGTKSNNPPAREQTAEELLTQDHNALDHLLQTLTKYFDVSDAATTCARLDLFWARLAMHIRAENLHVFPSILNALDANPDAQENSMTNRSELTEALAVLRRDHEFFMLELARAVTRMRDCVSADQPSGTSKSPSEVSRTIGEIAERLNLHNKLEEELIYRLPERLISSTHQQELAANVRRELENLPPRFAR